MENKEYQEIFDKTKGLQGEELEKALLAFSDGNKQMVAELKAMFARIDTYHEVIQTSKKYKTEDEWVDAELQAITDTINAKSKDKVTMEDVRRVLWGGKEIEGLKSNY